MCDERIRYELMTQQLSLEFNNKYEIIKAYTVHDQIVRETYDNLTLSESNINALSQIAICYSHKKCIEKISKNKMKYGAIIEDDIRLKQGIKEYINKYMFNTPELENVIANEPCIIHICGPPNYIANYNKFIERKKDDIVVNICFYIINYQMADILLDNFYPIQWQFDTFVSKLVRQLNIKEYTATPILAWDLSSPIYKNFWSKEDIIIRKHIQRTSNIIKKNLDHCPNIVLSKYNNPKDPFYFIINRKKKYKLSDNNVIHYLSPYISIEYANSLTIIAGHGINSINQQVSQPMHILYVRGPITRKAFDNMGIKCPELYIDPLIIMARQKPNDKYSHLSIVNKLLVLVDYDMDFCKNHVTVININKYNFNEINNFIINHSIIVSNVYFCLVLSTTYNKKTIPVKRYDSCDISYIDYLLGFNNIYQQYDIIDLEIPLLSNIMIDIRHNRSIDYPQPNHSELLSKIDSLLFYTCYI